MTTDKWLNRIDIVTAHFKDSFDELTIDQLNWKPNEETWSIAQNIEHLIIINESYYPIIASIRTGEYKLPFIGKIGFIVTFLGRTILNSVQPERRKKMKTFPIWEPTQAELINDILSRFEKHQLDLKQSIINSQDLLSKKVVISSPANRNIVYKLETAWEIIITHEQRHLEQSLEVLVKQNEVTPN